ncbi:glycosyltransferase family 4 protein [Parasphingorhabdus pacifica]
MSTANIRVLLDGTPLLGSRTGIGRYTAALVDELTAMSEVDIRLMGFTMRGWRRLRVEASDQRVVGPPLPARVLRALWSRGAFPPVELLGGGNADVMHGTNFSLPPAARAGGVVTVHDLAFLDAPEKLADPDMPAVMRRSVQRAEVVCTLTNAVRRRVQERFDVPEEKLACTPLGVNREWFEAEAPDTELRGRYGVPSEYVLFVGDSGPRKGLAELLRAYTPDLPPLVIAGPGPASSECGIVRTGYLPDEELRRIVAGASALVLPSQDEGFGLPALEALACGVPVACSDVPALREVTDGHAVLFPYGDAEALNTALRDALALPTHELAVSLRRSRAARFTWRACAEATVAAYRRASGD